MKKGDKRTISIEGEAVEAEYLGRGRHAVAYKAGETVYLFVMDEGEYMKEAVSLFCSDMPHVPKIEKHGDQRVRGKWATVYSMPYYRNVTARDREAWATLKILTDTAKRIFAGKYAGMRKPLEVYGLEYSRDIIEETRGKVPESVTEALNGLFDAGSNYGCGVAFEFGKRNIGVDADGRIVFRDILFDAEKIARDLAMRRRKARGY